MMMMMMITSSAVYSVRIRSGIFFFPHTLTVKDFER